MKPALKPNLKLNLWLSLCLTAISLSAAANTTTTASTTTTTATTSTTASTATTPTTPAAPAAVSTVMAPKKDEAPKASFGLSYDLGYSMQAKQQPDGSRSQSMSHDFVPNMSYSDYSGFIYYGYSQDLVDTDKNGWSPLVTGAGYKGWEITNLIKMKPSVTFVFPMSDSDRYDKGLLYGFSGALKFSLNTKKLGMDAFRFSYEGQLSRNNLEFDTNAKTGSPNKLYGYRNRFDFGYDITDSWSLSARFDFSANYSVNGVVNNTFEHSQTIGYGINDHASLSLSHSNSGPYLKAESYENNLKFFNDEDSTLSMGLSLSI